MKFSTELLPNRPVDAPHVSIQLVDQAEHGVAPERRHQSHLSSPKWLSRVWSLSLPKIVKKEQSNPASCPARNVPLKRTEPKTFFANERTFIAWLQFSALLLTVALNLFNNGDHISRIVGAAFIIIASLISFYALVRFHFRAWQLRTGRTILRYDDLYGPSVLCITLVIALMVNFYLRASTLLATSDP